MIEVRIPLAAFERLNNNEPHCGMRVLRDLRKKAVPVVGVLWPSGVTTGTLSVTTDEMFDEQVWTWKDSTE